MFYSLAGFLHRVATVLAAGDIHIEKLPILFNLFAEYIAKESAENFFPMKTEERITYLTKEYGLKEQAVPLRMKPEAIESFDRLISKEFPDRLPVGRAMIPGKSGEPIEIVNFLYILGQTLVSVVLKLEGTADIIKLDAKELPEEEQDLLRQKLKRYQEAAKKLYDIWGGEYHMNARELVNTYAGKDTEFTKRSLANKLKKSAIVAEQEIIPAYNELTKGI